MRLRIATRGSALALTQSKLVAESLKKKYPSLNYELVIIKTRGDKFLEGPLSMIGDKGLFVKELESALLKKEADLAIHSTKDLPAEIPEELTLAAFPVREDPRDVLVTREDVEWQEIPQGVTLGTSALRRQSQVLFHRPDLTIEVLRGNVDTRLKKLDQGLYYGVILAKAGLNRLSIHRGKTIPLEVMLPAPGQGSLAIEARRDDSSILEVVSSINDISTSICVQAERAFLQKMEGGCQTPLGCLATLQNSNFAIEGFIALPNGSELTRKKEQGSIQDACKIAKQLALKLLAGKQ